jgi:hypothetical protein
MRTILIYMCCLIFLFACNKQEEWLDVKSNRADVTPTTIKDFQALLDNPDIMNDLHPGMPLASADNYYVLSTTWQADASYAKNVYNWASGDFYLNASSVTDWAGPYITTEYANIALEGLNKIPQTPENLQVWNNCKGSALFYRAYSFFDLVNTFAKPYNATTAATDLAIPLRLTADVNERSVRASVQETYDRIITDLKEALLLLPATPLYQTRPSTFAANALLARAYLAMGDYVNAGLHADKALAGSYKLIDFNTLSTSVSYPMPTFPNNPEIIFFTRCNSFTLASTNAIADSLLVKSYGVNDLRKNFFYTAVPAFKGSYTTSSGTFGGLAINEQYLIRAEAAARAGNATNAMQDLSTLLAKRWKANTFVALTATSAANALDQVIAERRKELPFTGILRWIDLRRLNSDSRYALTLTRILNNQTYTLPPNDSRYVLPIPDLEIKMSGIQQNPR